jgi:hypothetical protein
MPYLALSSIFGDLEVAAAAAAAAAAEGVVGSVGRETADLSAYVGKGACGDACDAAGGLVG